MRLVDLGCQFGMMMLVGLSALCYVLLVPSMLTVFVYLHIRRSFRGDAGDGRIPVVAHRKNNGEWLVSLPADAFLLFVKFCVSDKMVGEKL